MIYENRIKNRELRNGLALKIKKNQEYPYGSEAENLTFVEYREISKVNWFPKLQKNADSIFYSYSYDGFLPDYTFELSFTIPKTVKVDTTELKYGEYNVEIIGTKKRVNYFEYED